MLLVKLWATHRDKKSSLHKVEELQQEGVCVCVSVYTYVSACVFSLSVNSPMLSSNWGRMSETLLLVSQIQVHILNHT